ncbi:ArsR/SmtB family transcription factor [Thalassiella azotivora]
MADAVQHPAEQPDEGPPPPPPPPPHGPHPPGAPFGPWSHRPADDAEARALASGLRLQILRLTLRDALTNKEIAERLDRNPASVLHHVRTLVATGFLVADDERRGTRGAREVPYRATGKSWYLTQDTGSRAIVDAFLAESADVPEEDLDIWRLGLRLDDEGRAELGRRLHALLAEMAARPPAPGGRDWSLLVALHPEAARGRPGRRRGA